MKIRKQGRTGMVLASAAAVALVLSACGGADDLGGGGTNGGGDATDDSTDGGNGEVSADCADFEQYGQFDGETVTLFSSIRETEADQLQDTFEAFTECTGITVEHNGSGEFEQQVVVQAEGGNAPDLAVFPQPGLLQRMVGDGHLVPASEEAGSVKVSQSTVVDYARSVTGWVEGGPGEYLEVPGVGGAERTETMTDESCQFFYRCNRCGTTLRPREGDCCVFCSYATRSCPPIQTSTESCC